jgi:hypothetical protein
MVGIFEAGIGFDRGWRLELCHELLLAEIGPAIGELSGVGAIAGEAGAVGENLRDGGIRDLAVEALHILPDRIVQPQFPPFAELHESGCGETLGM